MRLSLARSAARCTASAFRLLRHAGAAMSSGAAALLRVTRLRARPLLLCGIGRGVGTTPAWLRRVMFRPLLRSRLVVGPRVAAALGRPQPAALFGPPVLPVGAGWTAVLLHRTRPAVLLGAPTLRLDTRRTGRSALLVRPAESSVLLSLTALRLAAGRRTGG